MKLIFSQSPRFHIDYMMRRCGYGKIVNRGGEISYARIMGTTGYPRFHAYVEEQNASLHINLHLDQKKPTYGDATAHNGEYDGETVEREGERVKTMIDGMK